MSDKEEIITADQNLTQAQQYWTEFKKKCANDPEFVNKLPKPSVEMFKDGDSEIMNLARALVRAETEYLDKKTTY